MKWWSDFARSITHCDEEIAPRVRSGRGCYALTPPPGSAGCGLLPWSCEEHGDTLSSPPPLLHPTTHTHQTHFFNPVTTVTRRDDNQQTKQTNKQAIVQTDKQKQQQQPGGQTGFDLVCIPNSVLHSIKSTHTHTSYSLASRELKLISSCWSWRRSEAAANFLHMTRFQLNQDICSSTQRWSPAGSMVTAAPPERCCGSTWVGMWEGIS